MKWISCLTKVNSQHDFLVRPTLLFITFYLLVGLIGINPLPVPLPGHELEPLLKSQQIFLSPNFDIRLFNSGSSKVLMTDNRDGFLGAGGFYDAALACTTRGYYFLNCIFRWGFQVSMRWAAYWQNGRVVELFYWVKAVCCGNSEQNTAFRYSLIGAVNSGEFNSNDSDCGNLAGKGLIDVKQITTATVKKQEKKSVTLLKAVSVQVAPAGLSGKKVGRTSWRQIFNWQLQD